MIKVITSKPIATDSPDHTNPHGTAQDNSTNPEFNRKLYELIPRQYVQLLDLGCAGGGLVKSILEDGGMAVGIEGSDYSRRWKRACWPVLGGVNLFTADITEEFRVEMDGYHCMFNVVTAWETFEHLPESRLGGAIENILCHLSLNGLVIGSINSVSYIANGVEYHATRHPRAWWIDTFERNGLRHAPDVEAHFGMDVVRGPDVSGSFVIALRHHSYFEDHIDADD